MEKKQNKNRRSVPRRFGEQKNAAREVRADISLDEYVDINSDVSTNAAVLNRQDILAEVVGCVAELDDDEDESSDEPVAKPPISEVHKAIEILGKFTLF